MPLGALWKRQFPYRGATRTYSLQFEGSRHRWPFEDELLVVGGRYYAVSAFPSGGASLSPMSIQSAESSVESPKASRVVKRSIVIASHKTSISLEDAFWAALKRIAQADGFTLSELVATIDKDRQHSNLSSAIRLFVLAYFQKLSTSDKEPK
jgi:predicted DNA-binding ribbon-helix-helix protein